MSENEEPVQQELVVESAPVPNIGVALAEAREALGISIEEAAQQLRLSARQLHALEANDYSGLPGATFIRGFIRNYARLLQLDSEPLLLALDAHSMDAARHAITLQSEDIAISHRDQRTWLPYVIGSVVIGVLLGSWMLYMDYRESHPSPKPVDTVAQSASDQSAGGYSPESVALPGVNDQAPLPVTETTEAQKPAAVAPVSTAQVVVAHPAAPVVTNNTHPAVAGTARLKLVFSQQSWVRVFEHDGKEVFHKTGFAGTEDIAEGVPPLKVEVGNAAGVQITFNDKPVDMTPHTKANVARFSLE